MASEVVHRTAFFDPVKDRDVHRITTVYATSAELDRSLSLAGEPAGGHLRLGRLARFYKHGADELPRVISSRSLAPEHLETTRYSAHAANVVGMRLWLFQVPAAPLVAALTIDVECEVLQLIPLLEDCYYSDVHYGGHSLPELIRDVLNANKATQQRLPAIYLEPSLHQLAYLSREVCTSDVTSDLIQRLIYRADLDYDPSFSSIRYPSELNRRPASIAAVGPFVSVLVSQQDYIENCALLSAVQIVAASSKLREIRGMTYRSLRDLESMTSDRPTIKNHVGRDQLRDGIAFISERLSEHEIQLTFSVESAEKIGLLVPSLRVESYHSELASALQLRENAETVSKMLTRLGTALAAEQASVTAYERRCQELRRRRYTVAVGFLSTVAIPISIIVGFFSGQSSEVYPRSSMFSLNQYGWLYSSVLLMVVATYVIFALLWLGERRELRQRNIDASTRRTLMRAQKRSVRNSEGCSDRRWRNWPVHDGGVVGTRRGRDMLRGRSADVATLRRFLPNFPSCSSYTRTCENSRRFASRIQEVGTT